MSLFDKFFTVETVDSKNTATAPVAHVETIAVNAVVETTESVVAKIYAQNELSEEGDSIYAVSKLMNTLPKEMTTQKMQQTIAGILAVTEKSVPALIADGHKRIEVLNAARDNIVAERTEVIVGATSDIERLKQAIEVAEKVIKEAQDIIEATKHQVADEVDDVEKLIKFSEGMVSQE